MDWKIYFIQGIELVFLGMGSYYDIKSKELPLPFLVIFLIIAIVSNFILRYQDLSVFMIGGCIGVIFLGVGWITKEEIGYGDGIGLLILGFLMGVKRMVPVIITAFFLSSICGLWKVFGKKESVSSVMPFFPFLFIAAVGVLVI